MLGVSRRWRHRFTEKDSSGTCEFDELAKLDSLRRRFWSVQKVRFAAVVNLRALGVVNLLTRRCVCRAPPLEETPHAHYQRSERERRELNAEEKVQEDGKFVASVGCAERGS